MGLLITYLSAVLPGPGPTAEGHLRTAVLASFVRADHAAVWVLRRRWQHDAPTSGAGSRAFRHKADTKVVPPSAGKLPMGEIRVDGAAFSRNHLGLPPMLRQRPAQRLPAPRRPRRRATRPAVRDGQLRSVTTRALSPRRCTDMPLRHDVAPCEWTRSRDFAALHLTGEPLVLPNVAAFSGSRPSLPRCWPDARTALVGTSQAPPAGHQAVGKGSAHQLCSTAPALVKRDATPP
jgi:hypothetical protein